MIAKEGERCTNCNQVHLRPGYCQALDPINAGKYPQSHKSHKATETETEFETSECQPWVDEGISRATYFRRRAKAK
jgi:hypothetical protein